MTCWSRVHSFKALQTCAQNFDLRLGVTPGSLMTFLGHTVIYSLCGLNHGLTNYRSVFAAGQSTDVLIAAGSLMICLGTP